MANLQHAMADYLALCDLHLFSTSAFYDLEKKSERLRSVADIERFFFRLAGILGSDLFVEAGARDAASSVRARRHLANARIVAFEANPLNYTRHRHNIRLAENGVEYLHKALSDQSGTAEFNVQIVNGRASADGQGSILPRPGAEGEETVSVDAVRLDEFFPKGTFTSCCIWVDVEGATQQVLKGAEEMLPSVDLLFVEVEDRAVWDGQWLSYDVMSFLNDKGFLPVARDYQSRYQYNVLFLRREILLKDRVRFAMTEHVSRVGNKLSLRES